MLAWSSTTSTNDGSVAQSAEAWEAEYDAGSLGILAAGANPPRSGDLPNCSRDPADLTQGPRLLSVPPIPSVAGQSACSWSFSASGNVLKGSGCPAASFEFGPGPPGAASATAPFDVRGALPPPRPASAIAAFTAQQSGLQVTASWSVTPSGTDAVGLDLGSFDIFPRGPAGGGFIEESNDLTCQVNVQDTPFAFPQADAGWALVYQYRGMVLSLNTVSDQVFTSGTPLVDFVLVRTINSVTASRSLP
ncbi:MAG TPA: hypothetical protein VN841_04520 [Bryobacteraceae bacterium]|nr:hypothetical protein [Bryobacteraceae bacterium]